MDPLLLPWVTLRPPGGAITFSIDPTVWLSGQGQGGTVNFPGVGAVPWEITIGPPSDVSQADLLSSRASGIGMLLLVAGGAFLLAKVL